MKRLLLAVLCLSLPAALLATPAPAQIAGLDQLGDWYILQLDWRSSAGLPADIEFAGPVVAAYNWAYGATVLGVNVRLYGTDEYYAAMAVVVDNALETLDTVGPLTGPARLDIGPYHFAAGLPDERLIIWLTAPSAYPSSFVFSTTYEPDTAFDFAVYPPTPVDTNWVNWWITGAYEYGVFEPSLVVASTDGAGAPRGGLSALNLSGDLRSLAYADIPLTGTSAPYLLYSMVRDRNIEGGNNNHITAHSAWFSQQTGWYVAELRNAGLYAGKVWLTPSTAPLGVLAYDESDLNYIYSSLQFIQPRSPDGALLQTSLGLSATLPVVVSLDNFCPFSSVRSDRPMVAFSDSTSVLLGYYIPSGTRGNALDYAFSVIHEGEMIPSGLEYITAYPIQALAATAHWSSGNPEIYFVQRGTPNNNLGALFRLSYQPPTVRPAT